MILFIITANITICLIQKIAPMTFNDLKNKIFANYEAVAISDYEMAGLFSDIADYLNLKTTTNTAEFRGKSFNGIKNFEVPAVIIDGIKFYKNNY